MQNSFSARFTTHMLQGAREAGADVDRLLEDLAIDPQKLQRANARISYRQHADLAVALRDTLQDEMLGLLDKPVKPNTLKMLTYSAINADTIGDAMQIWAEAAMVLDVGFNFRWQPGNENSLLIIERRADNRVKNQHAIEYLLFAAHRVFCWFADQLLPLASVELDYKKPDYADEYRRLFVGAPISYDRERCSLAFRQSVLSLPNVRDFNALKRFLRELPLALYATNYVNQDIAGQLNNWLAAHTRRNQKLPGVDEASNYLGLHPQGMRRALAKSGNSFAAIRAQVLREAAKAALLKGEKSVEQIAYDLGFSERGAFIRAFKRWTGLTPLAWKKQLAMQP